MKTIFSALCLFSIVSCQKSYVCQCGNEFIDAGGIVIDDTKKNAKKKCDIYDAEWKATYNGSCELVGKNRKIK